MGAKLWYLSCPAVSLGGGWVRTGRCQRAVLEAAPSCSQPLDGDTHQISNLTFISGRVFVRNAAPTVEACDRLAAPEMTPSLRTPYSSSAAWLTNLVVEELPFYESEDET